MPAHWPAQAVLLGSTHFLLASLPPSAASQPSVMNSVALTDAQIDSCRPALDQAWAAGRAGPRAIAIVAYADRITQPWQLGWSALLHRMPFILIGPPPGVSAASSAPPARRRVLSHVGPGGLSSMNK